MSLKYAAVNGVKVYNVSGGKSMPQWLSEKKLEALRKDDEFRRRIELIQACDEVYVFRNLSFRHPLQH